MELASREIRVHSGQDVLILPIGDIQYAGEGGPTALSSLKQHIQWGVDNGAWFIGMGDYIDFASPSNRQRLASAALYDTANDVIELSARRLVNELYERALKPSRDRWLGLTEGHHFYQYSAGHTTDMELCSLLRTQHLGTCAYVRLLLYHAKSTHAASITIWAHHGAGYGGRTAAPLNRLDQLPIYWDADIYLMGHQSKKVVAPLQRVEPIWNGVGGHVLKHRTIWIACTGSFCRAYTAGNRHGNVPRGDYVEQKMLAPAALGGIKIRIHPKWAGGIWKGEISIEQ